MNTRTKFVIGENIRRAREVCGKSVAELCMAIGMSRAFWYDVEKGNKEASLSTLERMANALKANVFDLLREDHVTVFGQDAVPRHDKKPKRRKAS